jgi:hypothetical protein
VNFKRTALAVVGLGMLVIPMQAALAKEIGRLVISGPGLAAPIEVTDPDIANQLGPDGLENYAGEKTTAPDSLGDTYYRIDRGYDDGHGKIVATEHLEYYPDPAGGLGWVHHVSFSPGQSSTTGHWFPTRPAAEHVLLKLLADHGVVIGAQTEPVAPAASQPEPAGAMPLILGGAALLALGVVIGALVARQRTRQPD